MAKKLNKANQNRRIYMKAPAYEQIMEFIKELDISGSQFERFYGIAKGTIRQVAFGNTTLPAKHWHIIYEKIKPAYGVGYFEAPPKKKGSIEKTEEPKVDLSRNELLNELKNKLNG